tara:strand:+ start:13674 stop:14156 length:483 start_codon:yes stop_codon:yes gene_type:complete
MNPIINEAIELRRAGQFSGSRALLRQILNDPDVSSVAHLHMAWSYDNEGLELEAVPHYELSLSGQLLEPDHFEALFGLASTLRSLGRYGEALRYFDELVVKYPDSKAVLPFYAMCLYNQGQYKRGMELLLTLLADTVELPEIVEYERAIRSYAADLDRKW